MLDLANAFRSLRPGTPTYLVCGAAGCIAGLTAALGGGLLTGGRVGALAAAALAASLSFFGWALLRKRVGGRERLVLLEHVWLALGCAAGTLALLRAPVFAGLDLFTLGLALLLAGGRVGCLAAGCCHGLPWAHGVRHEALGVRLFPVQAVEAAALVAIAFVSALAIPRTPPGTAFLWFLLAYAVVRFGLEWLRGDVRPEWRGLSVPQWMAMLQAAFALALAGNGTPLEHALLGAALLASPLAAGAATRAGLSSRRHALEVRNAVLGAVERGGSDIFLHTTSRGLSIAASPAGAARPGEWHVSISSSAGSLRPLCRLAARALPEAIAGTAMCPNGRVLHFAIPEHPEGGRTHACSLYFAVCRNLEREREHSAAQTSRGAYFGVKGKRDG